MGYRPALDGFRALAVVAVLGTHSYPILGYRLVPAGGRGVDLFFVLSGFLITVLLLEREGESVGMFWRRRVRRLVPAMLAFLAVILAWVAVTSPDELGSYARAASIVYAINWFDVSEVPLFTHLWSLAVEEQFYLAWPLVLAALPRQHAWRVRLVVVAIGAVVLWRLFLLSGVDDSWSLQFRTDTRSDGLLIGVLLAFLFRDGAIRRVPAKALSTAATASLVAFVAMMMLIPEGRFYRRAGSRSPRSCQPAWSRRRPMDGGRSAPRSRLEARSRWAFCPIRCTCGTTR